VGLETIQRALLVVSLLPVSEINQRFRPGCGRTGGGMQIWMRFEALA